MPDKLTAAAGVVTAFIFATINLGVTFTWWTLTDDELAAVNTFVGAAVGLAVLVLSFRVVSSGRVALTNDDVTLIEAGRAEALQAPTPPTVP